MGFLSPSLLPRVRLYAPTPMERLEQRITELERRASRYPNALVLLVVGLCGVAVVGATNEGFYGIDEDGIINGKRLFLFNDAGEIVVALDSDSGGNGILKVNSSTGERVIFAGADVEGYGQLRVNSSTGEQRVFLGSGASGNGFQISGRNKTGEKVVLLMADAYGNGYVGAFDRKGMGRKLEPGP